MLSTFLCSLFLTIIIYIHIRNGNQKRSNSRSQDHAPETIGTHTCQDREEDDYLIDLDRTFKQIFLNHFNKDRFDKSICDDRDDNDRISCNENSGICIHIGPAIE